MKKFLFFMLACAVAYSPLASANFGTQRENSFEILTAADTLVASDCGKTIFLNSATEFAVTLPSAAGADVAGCELKVVVQAAPDGANYTVVTAASENTIIGGVNELEVDTADDGPYSAVGDVVTFVGGTSVVGDFVSLKSNGVKWYMFGQTQADGGVTIGST